MPNSTPTRQRQPPTADTHDDRWVDEVTDQVQALLSEHGLEMDLCVWYDPITEHLHAVSFDGSAARYFRSLRPDGDTAASPSEVSRPGVPGPPEVSSPL